MPMRFEHNRPEPEYASNRHRPLWGEGVCSNKTRQPDRSSNDGTWSRQDCRLQVRVPQNPPTEGREGNTTNNKNVSWENQPTSMIRETR
jgi:hypothetical protein